jgi:GT2 family glycosyltransferase
MLINLSKIKKIKMFDENYFLYLEEIDLCKRLKSVSEKIYLCGRAKITHLSAKSSNIGFEFEKCRNWHWMWSKVHYDKKFYGKIYAIKKSFFHLLKNFFKSIFFLSILNYDKFIIFYLRFSGTYNSLIGKKSWYRPKIN